MQLFQIDVLSDTKGCNAGLLRSGAAAADKFWLLDSSKTGFLGLAALIRRIMLCVLMYYTECPSDGQLQGLQVVTGW